MLPLDTLWAVAEEARAALIAQGEALERIVEWKDATEAERAVSLCNSGVVCADAAVLRQIWDGARSRDGQRLWHGYTRGTNLFAVAGTEGTLGLWVFKLTPAPGVE